MKRSRFDEEQIIRILKEQEAGLGTADLCRKHGISSATFYKWKAKYGGLEVSDARKLKAFADGFYGRLGAYETAADAPALAAALAKNLYRGATVDAKALALADYVLRARRSLEQSLPDALDFGPLPSL